MAAQKKSAKKAAVKKKSAAKKTTAKKVAKKAVKKSAKKKVAAKKSPATSASEADIASEAYQIYQDRCACGEPGDETGDWLEAKKRLEN